MLYTPKSRQNQDSNLQCSGNTILGRTHCTAWFSCHPCPPTGTLQSLMIKVRILFLTQRPPLYNLKASLYNVPRAQPMPRGR